MRTIVSYLIVLPAVLTVGCLANGFLPESAPALESTTATRTVEVRGRIVEMRPARGEVVIKHEAIPGEMGAMTMPFAVRDAAELEGLSDGEAVAFQYTFGGVASWISDLSPLSEEEAATLVLPSAPSYDEPAEASIYSYGATWTNQHGERLELQALAGRPVVMSMIFTNCAYACPRIVHGMKELTAQLPSDLEETVRYVLVSLDPDRDTPEALRRFAEGYELDPERWTLLRGDAESVRMLSTLLGVRYRAEAGGQVAHTSMIAILDEQGEIVHQQKGLGNRPEAATAALRGVIDTSQP